MIKIGIFESDHHVFGGPDLNVDHDVVREQARKRVQGKYGSPEPQTTTFHVHKKDQPCIGYLHEQYHLNGETRKIPQEALTENMTGVSTE